MSRIASPVAARHLGGVIALSATALILLGAGLPGRAFAVPSNSATADAWSAEDTRTVPTNAYASIGFAGPGSAAGRAAAGTGTLAGWCTMSGCAIAFPPDGQVCNGASGHSSFSDQVTVVSDAPDGTPVQVLATFQVNGSVEGTGAYFYQSSCVVFTGGVSGPTGSSGGVVVTANMPIASTGSASVGLNAGYTFGIAGSSVVGVANRCCYPLDAQDGFSMTVSQSCALTLTVPTLPPGATYVRLIGSGGHDYGVAPTAVAEAQSAREGLSPARPNPTLGLSRLDLTLTRARSVDVGVFDLAGRRVATLAQGALDPGTHPLVWDGRDAQGAMARGGMYFVRARGEGLEATSRILRVR